MNTTTRLVFPRDATAEQMAGAIQEIRRKQLKAQAMTNPHAEKAKEYLVHYLSIAAPDGSADEMAMIVDDDHRRRSPRNPARAKVGI